MISFQGNGIHINYETLHDYLLSDQSLFPDVSLMDFFETLHVLQFSRSTNGKKMADSDKPGFLFINPNFNENEEVPDDFYKRPIDITKCNALKGTKRMTNVHHINLFQRLLSRACASEMKISRLEYARMRIDYEFQRRDNLLRHQVDLIEHDVNEPQYLKDNEIAGYYGNVSLEALKIGFCNYFPIYQNEAQCESMNVQETTETIEVMLPEEIKLEEIPSPGNELHTVPLFEDAEKKDVEAPTRKRKYKPRQPKAERQTRKSARISQKETEDALSNLQKEFDLI